MKKDQNLPIKNIHSNNCSGKTFPNNSTIQETNHLIALVREADRQKKKLAEFLTK